MPGSLVNSIVVAVRRKLFQTFRNNLFYKVKLNFKNVAIYVLNYCRKETSKTKYLKKFGGGD